MREKGTVKRFNADPDKKNCRAPMSQFPFQAFLIRLEIDWSTTNLVELNHEVVVETDHSATI